MDHHVLTPLPGGRQLPLLAPASLDPAQLAGAVDRFLTLQEFRSRLYACLTSRADAQASRLVGSFITDDVSARGAALAVMNATNRVLGNIFARMEKSNGEKHA